MALQVVRGHDLARVYGRRIDEHERRIDKLEQTQDPDTAPQASARDPGEALLRALRAQQGEESRSRKDQVTIAVVVLVIVVFIGFLALISSWQGG